MGKPVVYVWKSEPEGTRFTPEEVSEASYRLLAAVAPTIPQKKILIKPNVTIAATRESGIVTDCAHVDGIIRALFDRGFTPRQVAIGEGGGAWMPQAFCVAGYADLANAYGIQIHNFNDMRLRYVEQNGAFMADRMAQLGRGQRIAQRAVAPDTYMINAPKLKTHNAMAITICVKNLMGTQHRHDRSLCGMSREYARQRHMDYELRFAREMCNLYRKVQPAFNMVDGVIARMGSGFHDGENYPLGLTVAGADGFAVDFACSYFIGLNPEHLLLFKTAAREGLAPGHISDIDIRLVSNAGTEQVSGRNLERLSSPRGFWVKYHRERQGRQRRRRKMYRLEEYYPGLYRKRVMARHSDMGSPGG